MADENLEKQIEKVNALNVNHMDKFLIFRVGDQLYGTPLSDIIEVIEPLEITPAPNSKKEFLGVINLRGEVLSVIDLRVRFKQPQDNNPLMFMIVLPNKAGKIAVLVDQMVEVKDIQVEELDKNTNLFTVIPQDCLYGVGLNGEKVVYLLNLINYLNTKE
jgi:purine-binding chemotaxis protein CheW